MGAGGDCAGWEDTSVPSSLHFCVGKCVWKVDPRVIKIKKPLGKTKCPSYLQRAGLPDGKCSPGRGSSTQPRSGGPPHPALTQSSEQRTGSSWGTPEVRDLLPSLSVCLQNWKPAATYLQVPQSLCRVKFLFQVFSQMIQRTLPPTPLTCRFGSFA